MSSQRTFLFNGELTTGTSTLKNLKVNFVSTRDEFFGEKNCPLRNSSLTFQYFGEKFGAPSQLRKTVVSNACV
jgi:hypothetical protein